LFVWINGGRPGGFGGPLASIWRTRSRLMPWAAAICRRESPRARLAWISSYLRWISG